MGARLQDSAKQLTIYIGLIDLIADFRPDAENEKILSFTSLIGFWRQEIPLCTLLSCLGGF